MNENRHPIDDLFRNGLKDAEREAPMHVWEKIDQRRTPVYKLVNNFKLNSRWYFSVAAVLLLMSSAAIVMLLDENPGNLAQTGQSGQFEGTGTGDQNGNAGTGKHAGSDNSLPVPNRTGDATPHTMNELPGYERTPGFTPITETPVEAEDSELENPVVQGRREDPDAANQQGEKPEIAIPDYPEMPAPAEKDPEKEKKNQNGGDMPKYANPQPKANPTPDQPPVTQGSETDVEDAGKKKQDQGNEEKPIIPSRWSIEFLGSYDLVNRKMSGDNAAYLAARKASETPASAFSFQLRTGFRLFEDHDALVLKTGLSFSRINENFRYEQTEYYDEIQDRQVHGVIVDPVLGPQPITYTVRDTVTRTRLTEFKSRNSYTFIDVPLLLTWNAYTHNRFTLSASAGMLFNLSFSQQGRILSPVNNEVIGLGRNNTTFRTYAGADLMFNIGAAWKPCGEQSNFELLFEPGIRYGLRSLSKGNSGFDQRYQTINLFTGVRYRF